MEGSPGTISVKFYVDVKGWPAYRRKIAENFNRLSARALDDRQANRRYSEREREFTFANKTEW